MMESYWLADNDVSHQTCHELGVSSILKQGHKCGIIAFYLTKHSSFVWSILYFLLVGGFKHFLFSISYMGCHPSH